MQARDRFLSQFIARVTRAGHVYPGAISQYGFAVFQTDRLVLTIPGLELAKLENPIMDGDFGSATGSLSESERDFLLNHISQHVPAERDDFRVVLHSISSGKGGPDELFAAVRQHFPPEWSALAYRTHIYGILGRMTELGLLTKTWHGRRVQYGVASTASGILAA